MSTKVYGSSDDNVCFDGDVGGEYGCYGTDDNEKGVLVFFSDGTVIEAKYGKNDEGIWEMKVHKKGSLFDRVDPCDDADADPYSDVVHFADGLKWAYAASEWEKVS